MRISESPKRETKYRRLERILRQRIATGQYGEGKLLPSELDLVEEFKLSRHSVRRSLQLLEQEGWIARRQGRGTQVFNPPRPTAGNGAAAPRDVGVMIPCISIALYPGMARGVEDVVRARGFHMVLASYDVDPDREAACLEQFLAKPVAGVIACPSYNSRPADYQRVIQAGIPLVLVDTALEALSADLVGTDDFWSAHEGAAALMRAGCRRIAYLTGHMAASTSRERLGGFRTALEEANIPLPPQRILEGAFDANFGYAATRRLLEEQPEVDGLFVANDPIAVGVARALGELGRRMPICSYDEPALELGTDPAIVQSIIHLKQQRYALGHAAAEVLVRRVHEQAAGQVPPMPPARIRIKAELNEPARPVSGRVGRAAKEPQSILREQRGQQTLQPLSSG